MTRTATHHRLGVPMWLFLAVYVVTTTGGPIYWHWTRHGLVNMKQAAMSFFLGLNAIVCIWEMCLFAEIALIEKKHKAYAKKFKGRAMQLALDFFSLDVNTSNIFSSKLWAEVWATYSVFDPSYANSQSFGFFVDTGNGYTTLLPTLIFLIGMTAHEGNMGTSGYFLGVKYSARALGVIGMLSFYQELYGTCVYFLSFVMNKRHEALSRFEVAIFVCFTNGLWFILPILGMRISWDLIQDNNFSSLL
mmetsp:Transcript_4403/g.8466  ORF Transcript_4403/g.8466 Transcript_4403/m.8466 type:complete len:247 (-) Transcript_4403:290-1030(-)